jgi:hypothetical protein
LFAQKAAPLTTNSSPTTASSDMLDHDTSPAKQDYRNALKGSLTYKRS